MCDSPSQCCRRLEQCARKRKKGRTLGESTHSGQPLIPSVQPDVFLRPGHARLRCEGRQVTFVCWNITSRKPRVGPRVSCAVSQRNLNTTGPARRYWHYFPE